MSKPDSNGLSASFFSDKNSSFASSQFSKLPSSIFCSLILSEIIKERGNGINKSNAQAFIDSPPDLKKLLADNEINMIKIIQDTVSLARLTCSRLLSLLMN